MPRFFSKPTKLSLDHLRILVVATFIFKGCGSLKLAPTPESSTSGGWASMSEAFSKSFKKGSHYPEARPGSEMKTFLEGLNHGLDTARSGVHSENTRKAFQLAFFTAAKDGPSIPPDQVFQVIRTTLDDPNGCGGANCGRIFGINKKDINPLMDDMERDVKESPTLSPEDRRPLREKLLASLKKVDRSVIWDGSKVGLTRDGKNSSSLSGTCVVPALQAFGLRTLGRYPDFLTRIKGGKNSIDYRNNSPHASQLSTGACHLFATVEMFKHSKNPGLSASKSIDVPYTFAEIWSSKLGSDAEDAIAKELKFLESLESAQRQYMDELEKAASKDSSPKNQEQLFSMTVARFSLQMRFEGHGNSPLGDYYYLSNKGAIQSGHSLPALSMEEIEALGEKIALARLRVMEQTVLQKKSMSPKEKRNIIEGPIKELFAITERSSKAPRDAVKTELKKYRLVVRPFGIADNSDIERQFFDDLRAFGPIHIDVNSHSAVVAGYDARKKVFFVRDSDDPLRQPYTEIHQEEVFAQLKAYYVMRPKI